MSAFRAFSAAVLGLMAVATIGVFTFLKPQPPGYGKSSELKVPKSPPPDRGWTWAGGTPGWLPSEMSHDLREVDGNVWTTDLAPARAAARAAGVDPSSIRVLRASRYATRGGLVAIAAGSNASGRTCLGFVLPSRPVSFTCPQTQVGFVVVTTRPRDVLRPTWPTLKSEHLFPLFLDGIVRADVTRVVVSASGTKTVFERSQYFWGTFTDTPGDGYLAGHTPAENPWRARLDFYGAHGRLATLRIALDGPGYRLFTVR
jgi:hypothetical protein